MQCARIYLCFITKFSAYVKITPSDTPKIWILRQVVAGARLTDLTSDALLLLNSPYICGRLLS
jgi:hypothetical protein